MTLVQYSYKSVKLLFSVRLYDYVALEFKQVLYTFKYVSFLIFFVLLYDCCKVEQERDVYISINDHPNTH